MSLINGLLGGFNTAIDQAHARSDAKVKDQRETERAILTHLTTLDDRPDIQDRAISALAEWSAGAPPPKGGFLNRLVTGGDTAMHPAVRSVLDLLHTPGEPDVMAGRAGRATPATGASPTASPSGAAGGVSPVGPTPGSRGGMPVGGGPVGAPPPAVTPGPAVPIPGSAAQPARAATGPGGGPQSPAAGGSPTGAPPQVVAPPAGMAGVSFLPPDKTAAPPPVVNTPPQAGRPAAATAAPAQPSPAGPPPSVASGAGVAAGAAAAPGPAGAPLPVAGQPAGPDFSALLHFRPEDRQRLANQVHTDGLILEKGAEHDLQMRLWDTANPGASPEARQAHENQLLGSTPKWTNIPGTVPAAALPVDAADFNGQFIPPEKRNGSFVRQVDSVTKQERFLPVAGPQPTGPEAQARERSQELMASDPTLTADAALKQARVEHLQQTRQSALTVYARLQGTELSNQQKADVLNGTLHAGEALRIAASLLSQQPNVTLGQVEDLAHQLSNGEGQAPPTATAPAGKGGAPSAQPLETPLTGANAPPAGGGVSRDTAVGKVYKPGADAQKTIDTIAEARPQLADLRGLLTGKEGDNSFLSKFNAMKQAGTYWAGFAPSDPVYQKLLPLTSLLKVFLTTPYMRGVRALPYVQQIQQHMPSMTDTPALIIEKLDNIDKTLDALDAGAKASGQPQPTAAGTPAPAPVGTQGPALGEERQVNGQLAHWDGKGWLAGPAPKKGGGE